MKKPLPKLIALILLTALIVAVFCPFKTVFSYGENSAADVDERFVALGSETIIDKIGKAIFKGKTIVGEVYLGGIPIGISLESSGVKVIGISEIITGNGVSGNRSGYTNWRPYRKHQRRRNQQLRQTRQNRFGKRRERSRAGDYQRGENKEKNQTSVRRNERKI